jgi:hypothetical protein
MKMQNPEKASAVHVRKAVGPPLILLGEPRMFVMIVDAAWLMRH